MLPSICQILPSALKLLPPSLVSILHFCCLFSVHCFALVNRTLVATLMPVFVLHVCDGNMLALYVPVDLLLPLFVGCDCCVVLR